MNRTIKGIAFGLAAILLAFLGSYLWIKSVESRKWAEMEKTVRDLEAIAAARPHLRPVLRGSPEPGNALDYYKRALDQLPPGQNVTPVWSYIREETAENRSQAQEFLERHPGALATFREGTACGDSFRRDRSEPKGQVVSMIVRCKSRLLWEEGRRREACDLLLDLLLMAQDMERNGEVYDVLGRMVHQAALEDLVRRVLSPDLGREELMVISRGLEILDSSYPEFGDLLMNWAMSLGSLILTAETLDRFLVELEYKYKRPVAWRNGFSERLMMIEVFERELSDCRQIALGDRRSWAESRAITESVDRDRASYRGALLKRISSDPLRTVQQDSRERRARRRLLQMAAHYRGTGAVLTLPDPFGTTLLSREENGRMRFWSVGPDGVDDGGSGTWDPKGSKDIVLELKK